MFLPEMYHGLEKPEYILVLLQKPPIQPGHLIIVAIRIIVSKLRIAKLIPCQKHGDSPAAHQDCTGIAYHAPPQCIDRLILCLPFRPAVPAVVVIAAVCIIPSIAFIVLYIVRI